MMGSPTKAIARTGRSETGSAPASDHSPTPTGDDANTNSGRAD